MIKIERSVSLPNIYLNTDDQDRKEIQFNGYNIKIKRSPSDPTIRIFCSPGESSQNVSTIPIHPTNYIARFKALLDTHIKRYLKIILEILHKLSEAMLFTVEGLESFTKRLKNLYGLYKVNKDIATGLEFFNALIAGAEFIQEIFAQEKSKAKIILTGSSAAVTVGEVIAARILNNFEIATYAELCMLHITSLKELREWHKKGHNLSETLEISNQYLYKLSNVIKIGAGYNGWNIKPVNVSLSLGSVALSAVYTASQIYEAYNDQNHNRKIERAYKIAGGSLITAGQILTACAQLLNREEEDSQKEILYLLILAMILNSIGIIIPVVQQGMSELREIFNKSDNEDDVIVVHF